jgi:hypothetical protein
MAVLALATVAEAQRGGGGGRGGGGRGRVVQIMTLSTTSWQDGGVIPPKHAQPGHDVSPPLAWSNVPDGTVSFALIVHDIDAATSTGVDDALHWMVWNIPRAMASLPEGVPQGPQLADGTRQISMTGPNYRGPAAPSTGPLHHYVFELFALDTTLDVPAVGAQPPATRMAVVTAMTGHVRGKGTLVGVYRRTAP